MSRVKCHRAFTLVELLAALGILAVLLAVAVPSLSVLRRETSLATAQRDLMTALYMARSGAIASNAARSVVVTPPRTLQIKDGNGVVLYSDAMRGYGTDVTFSDGSGGSGAVTVTYDARGLLNPPNTVTLRVTNALSQTKTVTVSPTGRASAS